MVSVFVFGGMPPLGHLILKSSFGPFRWRCYGRGPPFYLEGQSSVIATVQTADVFVGWTGPFCSVDVMTTQGAMVAATFYAFPGGSPSSPSPAPQPH
jgi:hypothetical protein